MAWTKKADVARCILLLFWPSQHTSGHQPKGIFDMAENGIGSHHCWNDLDSFRGVGLSHWVDVYERRLKIDASRLYIHSCSLHNNTCMQSLGT